MSLSLMSSPSSYPGEPKERLSLARGNNTLRPNEEQVDELVFANSLIDPRANPEAVANDVAMAPVGKSGVETKAGKDLDGLAMEAALRAFPDREAASNTILLSEIEQRLREDPVHTMLMLGDQMEEGSYDQYQTYLRSRRMATVLQTLDKEYETGLLGSVGDALAAGVSAPLNFVTANWNYSQPEFRELYAMLDDPYVSEDDLLKKARALFDFEVDRSGWLTDKNSQYYHTARQIFIEGGFGTEGGGDKAINGIFGLLDAATLGGTKTAASFFRGSTALARAASGNRTLMFGGHKAAAAKLKAAVEAGGDVDGATFNSLLPIGGRAPEINGNILDYDFSNVSSSAMRGIGNTFGLNKRLQEMSYRSTLNREAIDANYDAIKQRVFDDLDKAHRGEYLLNHGVASEGDRLFSWQVYGTTKGNTFKLRPDGTPFNEKAVSALTKKLGGEVKLMKVNDGEGVLVRVSNLERRKFDDLIENPFNPQESWEVRGHGIGKMFGWISSARSRLDNQTVAAALEAESNLNSLKSNFVRDIQSTFRGLSDADYDGLDTMLKKISDGELSQKYSTHMTDAEFTKEWASAFDGAMPSKEVLGAYRYATELDDIVWRENSLDAFLRAEDAGFKNTVRVKESPFPVAIKPASGLEGKTAVDVVTGVKLTAEKLKGRKGALFDVMDDMVEEGSPRQVFVPEGHSIQRMAPQDILPFKPGFSREYVGMNQLIRSGKSTLGYASTRKIAQEALGEIENIRSALRELGITSKMSGRAVANRLKALSPAARTQLDNVVKSNTSWAHDIDDLAGFSRWLHAENPDFMSNRIGIAKKGEDIDGRVAPVYAKRETDMIGGLDSRSRAPIRNLNGQVADTLGGFEAMYRSTEKALQRRAWRSVLTVESKRWLDAALAGNLLQNPENMKGLRGLAPLRNAKIDASASNKHAIFEQTRKDLLRMFNQEERIGDTFLENAGNWLADIAVEGGVSARLSEKIRNGTANLPDMFRSLAYNLKLAWFNPVQLAVQSSQMAQILAIAPGKTVQSIPMAIGARVYRQALRSMGPKSAAEVRRGIAQMYAKHSPLDVDAFDDFLQAIQDSGRLDVHNAVAEAGGANLKLGLNANRKLNAIGNINHRIFFEEGERWPRILSGAVSYLETVEKYGAKGMKSRVARDDWWRRQDDLTFNMTAAMSAPWQRSNWAVTFQFMGYMTRFAEMFMRRTGLSAAEKTRLAMGQLILFGGTGAGLVSPWMDKSRASGGMFSGMSDQEFDLLRDGAIGAIYDGLGLGAISERIAPAAGLMDWYENATENSWAEVFFGPGGGTAGSLITDVLDGAVNIFAYKGAVAKDDLLKVATNVSSLSLASRVYMGLAYGNYYTRSGSLVYDDIQPSDVLGMMVGGTPDEVDAFYRQKGVNKKLRDAANEIGKNVGRMLDNYRTAYEAGDTETAANLSRQIYATIAPLSPHDRQVVKKFAEPKYRSLVHSSMLRSIDNGISIYKEFSE